MLISHITPESMRWQSRCFNNFDYLDYEPDEYIKDSNYIDRMILVAPDIKNTLNQGAVFQLVKEPTIEGTLVKAASVLNPVLVLTQDPLESWHAFGQYKDIAIDLDVFTEFKRGSTEAEQKMFARFSFISKIKREILESKKRIWLIGFTQPHEIKRYGSEIFACVDNTVVREGMWNIPLTDKYYETLHDSFPQCETIPLCVYTSIHTFKSWLK